MVKRLYYKNEMNILVFIFVDIFCFQIGSRSSVYSPESNVRKTGSYIYEEFMPTDGTDVKVGLITVYFNFVFSLPTISEKESTLRIDSILDLFLFMTRDSLSVLNYECLWQSEAYGPLF